ncbi:hypothetical protein QBE52_10345 [Clostridiaceae bacterium 35-E11]
MLTTFKKKYFFKIAEIYFTSHYIDNIKDCDVMIYFFSSKFIKGCKTVYTLLLDLTKSEESLFSEVHKHTKRKIKKAENKDQLNFFINYAPTDEDIKLFSQFYNTFAKSKKLKKCSMLKLKTLKESNALVISVIKDKTDNPLCYHAYIANHERARVLYSASLFRLPSQREKRNFIGEANRYLHWMDIQSFREKGFMVYDFGGLTLDKGNEAMWNIDRFKIGFGGKVVKEYIYIQAESLRGKIYKKIKDKN